MRISCLLLLLAGAAFAGARSEEGKKPIAPPGPVLRIHDVRDLLEAPAPVRGVADVAGLAKRAREIVGATGTVEVTGNGHALVVVAPVAVQNTLADWLRGLREGARPLVQIRATFVSCPEPLGPGAGAMDPVFLDEEEVARLLEAIRKRDNAKIVTAPSLVCFDREKAEVSCLKQTSYVADHEVVRREDGTSALDPVIRNVKDGVILTIAPVVSADRRLVTLSLTATVSTVRRPIPRFRIAGGLGAEIQLPEVTVARWKRTVTMPSRSGFLVEFGAVEKGGARFALVVSAALIATPEDLRRK